MKLRIESVDVSRVFVDDQKWRTKITPALKELATSMLTSGQINPITVRAVGDEFKVISGRRRYSALVYIQEELRPNEKIKALVFIKDVSELQEELIQIDENIMREQLEDIEFDEAVYRRKQIYEELNPETRQHVAGGHSKSKPSGSETKAGFTTDASRKLNVSRRSIEKSISRAAKATDSVKAARRKGLLQSKVDLLVMLPARDQELLLPVIEEMDLHDTKAMIDKTRKVGAKLALVGLQDESKEDPKLRPLLRDAAKLLSALNEALSEKRTFKGKSRFDNLKQMQQLASRLDAFIDKQKGSMDVVQSITKRGGARKVIRHARA